MNTRSDLSYIAKTLLQDADTIDIPLPVSLTPSQQKGQDDLLAGMALANVCVLRGANGCGKTTVFRGVQSIIGGELLNASAFISLLQDRRLMAIDETFFELVSRAINASDIVFIDDFNLITAVVEVYEYPRYNLFDLVLSALVSDVCARDKKLILSTTQPELPAAIQQRAHVAEIRPFSDDDYSRLCSNALGSKARSVSAAEIFRFAPTLNVYQINAACTFVCGQAEVSTEAIVSYLSERNLVSNVDLGEVDPVDLSELKGADDLVEELEAKIALPFENTELAKELGLKPKRGVLLAGPPGTGKTTIGRALAHRLKSKFFLIDGTVIAGSRDFYGTVDKVFAKARKNAPAIIFIDDADVLFEQNDGGFYRYLLTMMDGLKSASSGKVCVMLTAMEPSSIPPAMLRSGRVELWLETRLPDESTRRLILSEKLAELPSPLRDVDVEALAQTTRGFTGADLKAVVEDAKLLFARAYSRKAADVQADEYFARAISAAREKRSRYGRRSAKPFGGEAIGFSPAGRENS